MVDGAIAMKKSEYITIPQLAKILGISRIAVYKKVKQGRIKAVRIGRTFAIPQKQIATILGKTLRKEDKKEIDSAVNKMVTEYGEVLKLLGSE
jgi:excisionase family DNA binding protein